MKRIRTAMLVPGMVVAQDAINSSNILVVSKGTVLNDEAIMKLTFHGIYAIYIKEDSEHPVSGVSEEETGQGEERVSRIAQTKEFQEFQASYEKEIETMQDVFNDIITFQEKKPDISALSVQATQMLDGMQNRFQVFDMLNGIRDYDDSTYCHCLNVALICSVFADWMHMSQMEKELATVSGLLHDIGKLKIPEKIIKKPARLTDEEYWIIKGHPAEGYRILYDARFNVGIQNAALMHHERVDGTGYPLGLKADQIDKYAKMVAIADVYDAMTAARVYRKKICPFQVIEMFEKEGLSMFDPEYLLVFLENMVQTYLRAHVILSDKTEGEIVMLNKQRLSRPILQTKDGFLNLMERMDLRIEEVEV